jgi:hypothetical protein
MSKFNRGKLRDQLLFVGINEFLYYGFKSKDASAIPGVSTADLVALGQTAAANIADNNSKILVFSPRSPKPPRYSKNLGNPAGQQQTFSSYIGYQAKGTALARGFTPVPNSGRKVSLRATPSPRGSMISAVAELENGALYVWAMDSTDFGEVASDLGLKSATTITTDAEKKRLVSAPGAGMKPGRAQKQAANGTISSFFSHGASIAAGGWSLISEESLGIDTYTAGAPA